MAVFNEPAQWDHTLGNNADTSTLPDDAAATAGIASLQKLFQIINATPLEAGGIAPDREDVNALFKYLGDQIFYTQNGGIPSYNAAYDYIPGRVVLYTDNNLYKCIQANGASSTVVAPGTDDAYWQQLDGEDTSTSLIPNQTITSELPLTDANLHLKDGALLSGGGAFSAYVDLIAELYNGGTASTSFCTEAEWQTSNTNYGFCNKFVYDSVANTVRLPKINSEHGALIKTYQNGDLWYRIYQDGWCEQGNHLLDVVSGSTISLPIPYLSDDYDLQLSQVTKLASEALGYGYAEGKTATGFRIGESINYMDIDWYTCGYTDISDLQVSPIYEYIVVGTVSKTDIQIDIDNVLTDLNGKADTDLSNVTSIGKATSVGWGMPDYDSAIDISSQITTVNNTITIAQDSYLKLSGTSSSDFVRSLLVNDEVFLVVGTFAGNTDIDTLPIPKGTYQMKVNTTGVTLKVYVIPCKGEN